MVLDSLRSGAIDALLEACDRLGAGPFDGEVLAKGSWEVDFDHLLATVEPAAVFHLGAITDTTLTDSATMLRENCQGFESMMLACVWRGTPLVYASSAATYGSPPQGRDRVPFPESAAGRPNNVYGFSKWMMECAHRRLAQSRVGAGEPEPWIVGLRYFNVFGPGERFKGKMASMSYQLAQQMLRGERPRLFSDGSQARDQVYIEDVVEGTLAAAGLSPRGRTGQRPTPGVYNLGSGVATSFNALAEALRDSMGYSSAQMPIEYFDMPASVRVFYQDFTCADMTAASSGLDWRPRWSPLEAIRAYGRHLRGIS